MTISNDDRPLGESNEPRASVAGMWLFIVGTIVVAIIGGLVFTR